MRCRWFVAAMAAGALAALAADGTVSVPPAAGVHGLAIRGEIQLRKGDLAGAAATFESAVRIDPDDARAWWGLGRVAELQFRRNDARNRFARAYGLDPRDSDIILSYLDHVADPTARKTLLRNVVALSVKDNPDRAANAAARLAIEQKLGGRPEARLASEYADYRVPLAGYRPAGDNPRTR